MTDDDRVARVAKRRRVNLRRQFVTVSLWRALLVMSAAMVTLAFAGIGYTAWVDGKREQSEREADRRWCALLMPLNDAYTAAAPATEVGRSVAAAIRMLVVQFGCPPK